MATIIYLLCLATSSVCAWLLLRSYQRTKHRLLLWSGLCFCGLSINNLFLLLDMAVFKEIDLSILRLLSSLIALLPLLYGLVWEQE
jgi:hypothetical protein